MKNSDPLLFSLQPVHSAVHANRSPKTMSYALRQDMLPSTAPCRQQLWRTPLLRRAGLQTRPARKGTAHGVMALASLQASICCLFRQLHNSCCALTTAIHAPLVLFVLFKCPSQPSCRLLGTALMDMPSTLVEAHPAQFIAQVPLLLPLVGG